MINNIIKNKKTIWYGLTVLAAVAIIVIVILFIIPGAKDKKAATENGTDVVSVKAIKIDDSSRHAGKLYENKVEDINDTALIVELFEEMELEEIVGEYAVEISQEGETLVLAINLMETVQNADKKVFDANVDKCAQQMLALIPQVGRVQWTYPVMTKGSEEEVSVKSLSRVEFASLFGKAPEYFGKSEENIKKLLEKQKES